MHSREPVSDAILYTRDMSDVEDVALKEDTPAYDDRHKATLHPYKIAMVGLNNKRFACQVVSKLSDGIVNSICFFLVSIPIYSGSGVFV